MKTGILLAVVLVTIIIVILGLSLSSNFLNRASNPKPTSTPKPTAAPTPTPPQASTVEIDHIDYFLVSDKGSTVQVQFALMSSSLESVSADGMVHLVIDDSSTGHSLYEDTFFIFKTDFGYYQTVFGLNLLAYQWSIPISSVQKCISYATASLTFTINEKSWSETEDYISLPEYTEEELLQMYENQYLQSAKQVGQTVTNTNFAITLVRLGPFTHLKYNTWGDEITHFRIDFKVVSLAQEPEYLFESDIVIVDNLANQYNREYGGTLDLGEIYPGVIKQGYVLFPAIDDNARTLKITVAESDYPEDIVYEFNVSI